MNKNATQSSYLFQFLSTVVKEAVRHKIWVVLLFALVSLGVLGVGMLHSEVFRTFAVIKVVEPDLEQAPGPERGQQLMVVAENLRQSMFAPELIKRIADSDSSNASLTTEDIVLLLESGLVLQPLSDDLVRVSLEGGDPTQVHSLLSSLSEAVVAQNKASKRDTKKENYLLIDQQTKNYKAKIIDAENRIKQLVASNYDGTEQSAREKITSVKQEIESNQSDVDDAETQIKRLEVQLAELSKSTEKTSRADKLREKLQTAEAQLEEARKLYPDADPNVVDLSLQIEDLKYAIAREQAKADAADEESAPIAGMSALQSLLSSEQAGLESKKRKLKRSTETLDDELKRLERIEIHQSQVAAVTRDYHVTKATYEELLSRKEEARLAMTLDGETNSVTFSIEQPAFFPDNAIGLRFEQYVITGLIIGAVAPFTFILFYLIFSSRIRFRGQIEEFTNLAVLGEVPRLTSAGSQKSYISDVLLLAFLMLLVVAIYSGLAVAHMRGAL